MTDYLMLSIYLIIVISLASVSIAAPDTDLRLAEHGTTQYVISLASDASAPEKSAATDLAKYLNRTTGADFRIVTPAEAMGKPTIAVGPGASKAVIRKLSLDKTDLGEDGIVMKTSYPHLALTGAVGSKRGTLYAVYEFLEREVGVRWWTHTEEFVPTKPHLTVSALNVRYAPAFIYREMYSWSTVHEEYHWGYDDSDPAVKDWEKARFAARMRNNGHGTAMPASLGGCYMPLGWCHTVYPFLPPDQYFQEHPEWYGEVDGKRTSVDGQLCMTNDEMLLELSKNILKGIHQQPSLGMVSVSQNDNWNNCKCAKCKAIDDAEGSPSGSLLYGINKVAEIVEKEFPDFYILTLAYQYTLKPPRTTRPRKNVIMHVAFDLRSFYQPLDSTQNADMLKNLKGWSSIGARIMNWDYYLNYMGPLALHPNFYTIAPDLRACRDNNAIGVFLEDETVATSYFIGLKTYLASHLLWDPSRDANAIIDEYMNGYYGKAAPSLRKVIDIFEKAASGVTLRVWPGSADASWASLNDMNRATKLFQQAEATVADNPVILARVKRARIPLDHQWLYNYQDYRVKADATGSIFLGPTDPAKAADEFSSYVLKEFAGMKPCQFTRFVETRMDKAYLETLTKRATTSK